jgi:hypothetical protein
VPFIAIRKEDLERKRLPALAALCAQIAGSPSVDKETADKAHRLRVEWIRLQQLSRSSAEDHSKFDSLKKHMIEFLTQFQ